MQNKQNNKERLGFSGFIGKYAVVMMLIIMFVFFTALNKNFASFPNIMNILKQSSIYGVMALGMLPVIITLGIDLSIASNLALTGVIWAFLCQETSYALPLWFAALVGVAVAIVIGLINGWLIAYQNTPAFIITLATGQFTRGIAKLISGGIQISNNLPEGFNKLGMGSIKGVPYIILVWLVLLVAMHIVMKYCRFGRHIYAIGGNMAAANSAGINTRKTILGIYTLSGLMSGIAGLLMASRISSGTPTIADGYEMQVVAAVVIGGGSLTGGVGNVWGTLLGVLVLGTLTCGMSMQNIASYYQTIVQGLVIVFAVVLDVQTKRAKKK